jgi:hypothetical protein
LSSKSSSSCFFACLFNSEDGGGTFLRNVDWLPKKYTVLCPER